MDAPDGQVPAPRRAVPPRLRRPADPAALPFGAAPDEDTPRVADLSSLLADIDALRLTLQTDLSLAAAALEEGAQDLAAELVDGDLQEVRAFAGRATDALARLDAPADELPVLVPVRRRRILSAAPLMAAAAALVGFVAFSPSRPAATPETSLTGAMAGYGQLSRLASEGAPDEQLRLAAMQLNDELAALIAQAADDPAAAQQALMLLDQTSEVLAGQGDSGVLRGVLAETVMLRERLRDALPAAVKRPARPAPRPALPVLPRVEQEPDKERTSSAPPPKASPKPASPKPSPSPSPAPSTAPSSAPEPPPTSGPSPQPSDKPAPLPGEDLPGT